MARPGATVGAPGIAITTRPDSNGSFLVSEVITLPAPLTQAVLRPPSIGDAGTRFKPLRPTAMQVEVSAGGQAVAVPDGPVRSEVTLRWSSPARQLQLRYRLTQVSVASRPAKAGRTVAAFGSLLDGMPADLPVKVVVTGRTVLSLSRVRSYRWRDWPAAPVQPRSSGHCADSVRSVASAGAIRPAGKPMRL